MTTAELPTIFRTHRNGCFERYTNSWGTFLRPVDDPDANVIIGKNDLEEFELREDINKIPADLWQRWVQLCFYFVEKVPNEVEVSIRILRDENDPTKYRFLVPEQKVSAAAVRAEDFSKAVDIETGEEITQYPPAGWIPVGSSHSHNTMSAFFSGVDDKYELSDPGIHIVVGSISKAKKQYSIASSVVANFRRFKVPYESILDADPIEDVTFHENVLKFVDYTPPKAQTKKAAGFITSTSSFRRDSKSNTYQQWHQDKFSKNDEYKDPFHYRDSWDYTEFWENYDGNFTSNTKEVLKPHHVEDLILDYIKQNEDDPEAMSDFAALLMSHADDIKEQIENCEPIQLIS